MFVDTSGLYALLVETDRRHQDARAAWRRMEEERRVLVTSSFVLHETVSLLHARVGTAAVKVLHESLCPLMDVLWIDENVYGPALAALLAAPGRAVSLTDRTSFEIMRRATMREAFAFDSASARPHFRREGFRLVTGRG